MLTLTCFVCYCHTECPVHLSKPDVKKRKPPLARKPLSPKKRTRLDDLPSVQEDTVSMAPSNEAIENFETPMMDDDPTIGVTSESNVELYEFRLPPGWVEWRDNKGNRSNDNRVLYNVIFVGNDPVIWKSVIVNNITKTFSRGLMTNPYKFINAKTTTTFNDIAEVDELLSLYEKQEMCKGIDNNVFLFVGTMPTGELRENIWRSRKYVLRLHLQRLLKCLITFFFYVSLRCNFLREDNDMDMCGACTIFKKTLTQKLRRIALREKKCSAKTKKSRNFRYLTREETIDMLRAEKKGKKYQKKKITRLQLQLLV